MNATLTGTAVGAVLSVSALAFGFWAMLLVALFMAVGALVGRSIDGRLDVRGVLAAFSGKRTSS